MLQGRDSVRGVLRQVHSRRERIRQRVNRGRPGGQPGSAARRVAAGLHAQMERAPGTNPQADRAKGLSGQAGRAAGLHAQAVAGRAESTDADGGI